MIDVSDVAVTTDGQDQEDEEVECESKPDTSSTFFRWNITSIMIVLWI